MIFCDIYSFGDGNYKFCSECFKKISRYYIPSSVCKMLNSSNTHYCVARGEQVNSLEMEISDDIFDIVRDLHSTFLQDLTVILKRALLNYWKILKE